MAKLQQYALALFAVTAALLLGGFILSRVDTAHGQTYSIPIGTPGNFVTFGPVNGSTAAPMDSGIATSSMMTAASSVGGDASGTIPSITNLQVHGVTDGSNASSGLVGEYVTSTLGWTVTWACP